MANSATTRFEFRATTRTDAAHRELAEAINDLRERLDTQLAPILMPEQLVADPETRQVVTVRMPPELHSALLIESDKRGVSMNSLCLLKLSQSLSADNLSYIRAQKSQRGEKRTA